MASAAFSPPDPDPAEPTLAVVPRRTAEERFREAVGGPLLGLTVNLALLVVKVIGGLASGSVALVADAGHSGADVLNNLLVLGSLIYSRRPADQSHPYGHDRAEVLAALVSAYLLAGAAFVLGWDSFLKLLRGTPEPGMLALWIAAGTLVVKLVVARVELRIAHNVTSQAVRADAQDSLADVLSSLAVIFGVLGARFGYPHLDGAAGLVIAGLILWTSVHIGLRASQEVLEQNLSEELIQRVRAAAEQVEGVHYAPAVTGRSHGSDLLIEIGIWVAPDISVEEGSAIADRVRDAITEEVPEAGNVLVELNADHEARLREQLR